MTQSHIDNRTTRRAFLGGTTVLAACAVLPRGLFAADAGNPNIGCITYSYYPGTKEDPVGRLA